jgi:uncharacterized protein (DUF1697 family)
VVFQSGSTPAKVKEELERRLGSYAGKPVAVLVRTAAELGAVLEANPFPGEKPQLTHVVLLAKPLAADALDDISGQQDEKVQPGNKEIYIHYPSGMGRSKLRIPAAKNGTARNMNTIAKLVEMTSKI